MCYSGECKYEDYYGNCQVKGSYPKDALCMQNHDNEKENVLEEAFKEMIERDKNLTKKEDHIDKEAVKEK